MDATGVYVVGRSLGLPDVPHSGAGDQAFVRKYDVNGTELWTHQFASGEASGVTADAIGIYVAGYSSPALDRTAGW